MIKYILFVMSFVALPLWGQNGDGVQITMDAPENVIAGTDFQVTVTISKGSLKDYSRFSQELPAGFTATNSSSPNADFSFDEQRVRIIWLKLPSEPSIQVKYNIDVHQRLSGTLDLGGSFAYVENGERKFLNIDSRKQVTVMPSPDIDQSLVVDISDFENVVGVEQEEGLAQFATVIRQTPDIQPNGIVIVSLLVQKPEGTKYLKLEETIPGGYSFEALQSNRAIVSQAASIAKFVWMKPPDMTLFILKYRLIPILEQEQEAILIQGTLTYTEGEKNMVDEIQEMDIELASLTTDQKLSLLSTGVISETVAAADTDTLIKSSDIVEDTTVTKIPEEKTMEQPAEVKSKPHTAAVKSPSGSVLSIPSLEKASGVYFRIQVAAIRKPYFANVFFGEYDLLKDVKVEQLDGWYKYTAGPASTYEAAAQIKKEIQKMTPIKNAFIIAYRDGVRIPVEVAREAL